MLVRIMNLVFNKVLRELRGAGDGSAITFQQFCDGLEFLAAGCHFFFSKRCERCAFGNILF